MSLLFELIGVLRHMQRYFNHICDGTDVQADWRRSFTYGRAPNVIDISQGSLTCPSYTRHGTIFFIRPSSDGTYYGMVMSVRPSQFSALFSYVVWDIKLKFCVSLYFDARKIKFECHQFPSIFAGVMPLLGHRILEIHSFPHFSLICFDILSWNFAYYFVLLQIKFECRQFVLIFVGVMPLLELRILEINSFPRFSLTCFDIFSWNFAYYFFVLYYRSSSSVVNLRQFF